VGGKAKGAGRKNKGNVNVENIGGENWGGLGIEGKNCPWKTEWTTRRAWAIQHQIQLEMEKKAKEREIKNTDWGKRLGGKQVGKKTHGGAQENKPFGAATGHEYNMNQNGQASRGNNPRGDKGDVGRSRGNRAKKHGDGRADHGFSV